jgi:hypothetical protein
MLEQELLELELLEQELLEQELLEQELLEQELLEECSGAFFGGCSKSGITALSLEINSRCSCPIFYTLSASPIKLAKIFWTASSMRRLLQQDHSNKLLIKCTFHGPQRLPIEI